MKFTIVLATVIAAVLAAPAAERQPEAQPALESIEKRCLANGADCIHTPNDCCSGSCFMDKGAATYRCAPWW
ncbi:Nn.00g108090.m01.CDS01 [Neocucurbitaria sp. VM-36]